jgi:GH24 family phage-related lysozyme (muramidase)
MASNKKVLATLVISTIVIYMLRKRIATALNNTPFAIISDKLFNVIASLEGFVAIPIWDYMQYSVGYGSGYNWDLNRPVIKTDVIDKETAKKWLLLEAQDKYDFVKSRVKVPVTDNQLLAMASFTYNVGENAFANSTLLRLLNEGVSKDKVALQFDRWVYAGGKVSSGLKKRRIAEKQLFLS